MGVGKHMSADIRRSIDVKGALKLMSRFDVPFLNSSFGPAWSGDRKDLGNVVTADQQ